MKGHLVYDVERMQPGCPILQAAMGGDTSLLRDFPEEEWLVAPTPGMALYPVTEEQLQVLVRRSKQLLHLRREAARQDTKKEED